MPHPLLFHLCHKYDQREPFVLSFVRVVGACKTTLSVTVKKQEDTRLASLLYDDGQLWVLCRVQSFNSLLLT